ncbi:hypothetical protein FPQ18DRAFT_306893 [Pyronema domesticum]|nr:hypothetical protein FPQ18DRAFT_306893 [Pyronema domesticum]
MIIGFWPTVNHGYLSREISTLLGVYSTLRGRAAVKLCTEKSEPPRAKLTSRLLSSTFNSRLLFDAVFIPTDLPRILLPLFLLERTVLISTINLPTPSFYISPSPFPRRSAIYKSQWHQFQETLDEITLNEVKNLAKFGLDVVALARLRHQKPFSFRPPPRRVEQEEEEDDGSKPNDVGNEMEEVPAAEDEVAKDLDVMAKELDAMAKYLDAMDSEELDAAAADADALTYDSDFDLAADLGPAADLELAAPADASSISLVSSLPAASSNPAASTFYPAAPETTLAAPLPESTPTASLSGVFEDWPEGSILLDWVTSMSFAVPCYFL